MIRPLATAATMVSLPNGGSPTAQTVSELLELFWRCCGQKYAARSLTERKRILDLFAARFGDLEPARLRPVDLELWLADHPEWKSQWTRRAVVHAIQRPLNWAVRNGLLDRNPLLAVVEPEGLPRRPVTDEEFARLIGHTDIPFQRLLRFLRATGCRPGEASALVWGWIDWERGLAVLPPVAHKSGRRTRRPRSIILTAEALALLKEVAQSSPESRIGPGGHVFVNRSGSPWNRSSLSLRMQRLRRRAGVPADAKLHGLRG